MAQAVTMARASTAVGSAKATALATSLTCHADSYYATLSLATTLYDSQTLSLSPPPSLSWVLNSWFLGRPEIVDFGGLGGPAALKTIPEGRGLRPPPFGMVFGAAGAVQTHKILKFRPAQEPCIKNSSVHGLLTPLSHIKPAHAIRRAVKIRSQGVDF